ncbi:hypothetical protein KGD82_16430 [Nocardiopsis eucommiae]|uniref:Uncharacterized protein n=1 Tax=Nocardiopsis eucommiae TaxID=2831970 RepID=A0A975L7X1_9ACTN|nr:hypothetical protein KGD82_16430 [Nocardiopsis eucommiae]
MANPSTTRNRLLGTQQAQAMFEVQEQWGHALSAFSGMVEQARRAGFTKRQARSIVAATIVQEVATSKFVEDDVDGGE